MALHKLFLILCAFGLLTSCSKSSSGGGAAPQDPLSDFSTCIDKPNGFRLALLKNEKNFYRCLSFEKKSPSVTKLSGRYVINLDNVPLDEKLKFADWADEHNDILKKLESWSSSSPLGLGEYLIVTQKIRGEDIENILNPVVMSPTNDSYINGFMAPKIFSSITELTDFIANPNQKSNVDVFSATKDSRVKAILDIYNQNFELNMKMNRSFYNADCSVTCSRFSDYISSGPYFGVYQEYIMDGQIYRSGIVLKDRDENTVAFLNLAAKKFSGLFLFERDSAGISRQINAYDINSQLAYSNVVDKKISSTFLTEREELIKKTPSFDSTVMICEGEFDVKAFDQEGLNVLAYGPHIDDSYFGWTAGKTSAKDFWQGRSYFNALDLPFNYYGYAEHAVNVSRAFLSNKNVKNVGIIPIGIDVCTTKSNFDKLWPTVKSDGRTRVINLSASEFMDRVSCNLEMKSMPILSTPELLWVVAAGNEGSPQPVGCPQYYDDLPNVIIVGASVGNAMHPKSNFNAGYVDVATVGEAVLGSGWGTSFAAPRVSAIANTVFQKYPQLSPEIVKSILILSAEDVGLRVSARGPLIEELVYLYADLVGSGLTIEQAVEKMECGTVNSAIFCEKALKKLEVLK